MNISNQSAIFISKLSADLIKLSGMGLATNLPGRIARFISKDVLSELSKQCKQGVIAVSGTNGKSTTSGFVASIMKKAGYKFVHNRQGANLITGITATLVEATGNTLNLDADYGLFEIDEAALPQIAKEVQIKNVLVTNLFRDQLDRFGELDTTAKLIEKGIRQNGSLAVLNSDDPNVARLAGECRRIFYGLSSLSCQAIVEESSGLNDSSCADSANVEIAYCANCGHQIVYEQIFYGQLGHYHCPSCSYKRPQPEVFAKDVKLEGMTSSFKLQLGAESIQVNLPVAGLFNVYNAVAASALAYSLNISANNIKLGLESYTTLFGRSETIEINGKKVIIQLIKNPAGATEAIKTAALDQSGDLLIAINDNYADGRDVSWLWDAQFEYLNKHEAKIVVSGRRAEDMAVRLKYAGINQDQIIIENDLKGALLQALKILPEQSKLWVLPTYTCLLDLQVICKALGTPLAET